MASTESAGGQNMLAMNKRLSMMKESSSSKFGGSYRDKKDESLR